MLISFIVLKMKKTPQDGVWVFIVGFYHKCELIPIAIFKIY
tara:strand:+ start:1354 stop:1476 length:123 start_codon:yes stop_codon:yes gene_type:complete